MYSNTPDSAIILYAYIGGVASFQRDLNTLVGTSVVYQDMDGVVFLRTRFVLLKILILIKRCGKLLVKISTNLLNMKLTKDIE